MELVSQWDSHASRQLWSHSNETQCSGKCYWHIQRVVRDCAFLSFSNRVLETITLVYSTAADLEVHDLRNVRRTRGDHDVGRAWDAWKQRAAPCLCDEVHCRQPMSARVLRLTPKE